MKKFIIDFNLDYYVGKEIIFAPSETLAWAKFEDMLIDEGFATFDCDCCIDWNYIFDKYIPVINEISNKE